MICPTCGDELDRVNAARAICPSCAAEYFISEHTVYPQDGPKETRIILEQFKPPSLEPDPPQKIESWSTEVDMVYDGPIGFLPPGPLDMLQSPDPCAVHLPLDGFCILCRKEAISDGPDSPP